MDNDQPSNSGPATDAAPTVDWAGQDGLTWRVELTPGHVVLTSGDRTLDIPQEKWAKDLSVAAHGSRYIIRIDTYELSVGFVLSRELAAPLLQHVNAPVDEDKSQTDDDDSDPSRSELMWPKISPLAIWALACSTLTFVPIYGLIPAAVTATLVTLHKRSVRPAAAWRHSRMICRAALMFLFFGLIVSGLAMMGLAQNHADTNGNPTSFQRARLNPINTQSAMSVATNDKVVKAADGSTTEAGLGGLTERSYNWGLILSGLLVILGALTVHEAAHAVTAWWLGDDFARRLGRVTLNPVAHIDPIGTVVLPLILFILGQGVFGWARPVPVRMDSVKRPHRGHILVSLAGPASNLLMAAASLLLLLGLGSAVGLFADGARVENFGYLDFTSTVKATGFVGASLFGPACTVLQLSFVINLVLAFFNLIPIPPLDGSWVVQHLFPRTLGPLYERLRPYSLLLFLVLIGTEAFKYLLMPVFFVLAPSRELLWACTPF